MLLNRWLGRPDSLAVHTFKFFCDAQEGISYSLSLCCLQHDAWCFLAGGNDKNAVVFNKDTEQVVAILQGHTKKVTSVIYHPEEVDWSIHLYSFRFSIQKCILFVCVRKLTITNFGPQAFCWTSITVNWVLVSCRLTWQNQPFECLGNNDLALPNFTPMSRSSICYATLLTVLGLCITIKMSKAQVWW